MRVYCSMLTLVDCRGWKIALDVASALVFLHSKGLVHLDVKSLNILLKGRRAEAKLGDLGLARMVPDGHLSLLQTLPSTPAYSSPEVIQAQLQWRLRTQGRKDLFKTEVPCYLLDNQLPAWDTHMLQMECPFIASFNCVSSLQQMRWRVLSFLLVQVGTPADIFSVSPKAQLLKTSTFVFMQSVGPVTAVE